jgi:hypothetical protein
MNVTADSARTVVAIKAPGEDTTYTLLTELTSNVSWELQETCLMSNPGASTLIDHSVNGVGYASLTVCQVKPNSTRTFLLKEHDE